MKQRSTTTTPTSTTGAYGGAQFPQIYYVRIPAPKYFFEAQCVQDMTDAPTFVKKLPYSSTMHQLAGRNIQRNDILELKGGRVEGKIHGNEDGGMKSR